MRRSNTSRGIVVGFPIIVGLLAGGDWAGGKAARTAIVPRVKTGVGTLKWVELTKETEACLSGGEKTRIAKQQAAQGKVFVVLGLDGRCVDPDRCLYCDALTQDARLLLKHEGVEVVHNDGKVSLRTSDGNFKSSFAINRPKGTRRYVFEVPADATPLGFSDGDNDYAFPESVAGQSTVAPGSE